jgi:hypothetical protein
VVNTGVVTNVLNQKDIDERKRDTLQKAPDGVRRPVVDFVEKKSILI